ncbi:SDR family oxidoreductase [Candidatus Parcubacteria bacterium]|nr:SDR family oxidoreductase [Candidatus Parcubacteria bacterium]
MLKDKTIAISGGSGELARVLAREFTLQGANVVLFSRSMSKLQLVADTLPPEQTLAVAADASNAEEVEQVFERAAERFGNVDAVVMSTGSWAQVGIDDSVEDASAHADAHYEAFFKTSFVTSFVAQQVFRAEGHGLIVNISSHAAVKPELTRNLTYGPMKAASFHLMKALRHELKGTGVRVTDIQPATINTPKVAPDKRADAIQPEDIAGWIIEHFNDKDIPESVLMDKTSVML